MAAWSFSTMGLHGKVVLLAGTGGLGNALGLGLADAGADLAIADVNADGVRALAASVREKGRRVVEIAMDITQPDDCRRAAQEARSLGPLYGAVNCVGIAVRGPSTDVSERDWDKVLSVNLKGAFFFAQAAARVFIDQGQGGKIVTFSSIMGLSGMEDRAAYCASKGGVIALSRSLAVEWAPHGITVNTVAPTFIRTPLNAASLEDPAHRARIVGRTPLGRLGQPEDVVGAVVYLLSEAAGMVTGHTLPVDGGWLAG